MKKKSSLFLIIALCSTISISWAQYNRTTKNLNNKTEFGWPAGKKMALSLTFDDARQTQTTNGLPLLDRYGVKATFYVLYDSIILRKDAWIKAVKNGHDIGNHTLKHPCTGNYEFFRQVALEDYTLARLSDEIDKVDRLISRELGIEKTVSFAYPCGQKFVGRGIETKSYVPLIAKKFETGRGWLDEDANDPIYCDLSQLTGMEMDCKSFEEIKKLIDFARLRGRWLILAGHNVNVGGYQTTLMKTLDAVCQYAADPAEGIWLDNVHNIAAYIKNKRESIKAH